MRRFVLVLPFLCSPSLACNPAPLPEAFLDACRVSCIRGVIAGERDGVVAGERDKDILLATKSHKP